MQGAGVSMATAYFLHAANLSAPALTPPLAGESESGSDPVGENSCDAFPHASAKGRCRSPSRGELGAWGDDGWTTDGEKYGVAVHQPTDWLATKRAND